MPERKRTEAAESGSIDLLLGTLPVAPSTFVALNIRLK